MRTTFLCLLLVPLLAVIGAGCGSKPTGPDARLSAEVQRYGLPETIARAREAVTQDGSAANYDFLARAYAMAKQPKPARENLNKAYSVDPTYEPTALLLARTLMQENKETASEQMMRTLLQKNPRSAEAAEILSRALLKQNRTSEVLPIVEEALKYDGKSVGLHWTRADTFAILKQYDKADKDYRYAMQRDSKNIPLRMAYVQTLVTGGKKDEGSKLALETVDLAPNSADVRFMAASALHQAGKLEEALAQYKEALVIKPDMIPAANNLALLLADRNQDTGTAVAWARKAAILAPKSLAIADTLGWALARDGQYKDALPILREVNKAWANNPTIWYHYGWTLVKAGQKAEGLKWLQQAAASASEATADAKKALQEFS